MDPTRRESSQERKKDKKKKHDRSYSHDKKKKKQKDRDPSREHKKKDKDKKHHKDKERSRSKNRRDKSKEPERERELERPHEKEPQRRQKQREREKETQRPRERELERKDRQRDLQRDRRQRSREKERSKEKKRKDYRSRSRSKKKKNDRDRRDYQREDKYEKWRRERDARFRFDSPPKSDQSAISDDPEKMDRLNKMKAEKQLVSSKADRKLYLGNLPPNITSNQLMQMLNSALKKMEINTEEEGDSIISAWVSPDGVGHYAFVEFRSAHQATAGLALNGASLYGYQLKLGRPKQYIEYQKQLLNEFGSDSNIDTILKKFEAMGGFIEPPAIQQRIVYPPSRVIVLKHIVTIEELAIDQEYKQIMEDITEMAKRFGDVIRIVIPRPMEIDLQEVKKRVKGLGYVFIKYKSIDYARYARKQFIKQMFSERSVACGYFPEKRFDEGDLDVIDKVVIDF